MFKVTTILKYAFVLILVVSSLSTIAQQLINPSFEGPRGVAKSPQGWQAYGPSSSPDTQPGAWSVETPASHGYTYMSMVCRGYSNIDSYKYESSKQTLQTPLLGGNTYHYSIDLAKCETFLADTFSFNRPVNLKIFGMNEMQQQELLWESGAVNHTDWKTVYFNLKPTQRTPFLVLAAHYVGEEQYNGNILIDNMQYYPDGQPDTTRHSVLDTKSPEDTTVITDNNINLNEYNLPETIDGREVHQEKELLFRGDELTITVWDNRTTDGDVISLFMNEKNILKEYEIGKDRLDVTVNVTENQEYYLTLYAHNLGEIPPNTVAMYISDGERKKFLTLSSNLNKCEAVKIKIENELVDNF